MLDETLRIAALRRLALLDTPPSETFDRITRMAARVFNVPSAAISLTDTDRQWFKSRRNIDVPAMPRAGAPCARIAEDGEALVVPDLLDDLYYADSPLARKGIRFYAGVPLVTGQGHVLGALCVLGTAPRDANATELNALRDLAAMTIAQIELQQAVGRIDALSGLPNRAQFVQDLDDIGRAQPGTRRLAVMVDLIRSDQIDAGLRTLGSDFLDLLVEDAARVTREALGPDRPLYHIATTQFAFLAPDGADDAGYLALLEAMMPALRRKANNRFTITAALGLAPFVAGQTSASDVLRMAYGAAQDGRARPGSVGVHAPASDAAHARRFRLLHDFETALREPGDLSLAYQPRIDLATGACCGAEALLRWRHPTLGDVSPGEFMPVIEQTTMIRAATAWVLDHALAQLAAWDARALRLTGREAPDAGWDAPEGAPGGVLRLSVNVSAANLEESDFAAGVQAALARHGVAPARLELEVTESRLIENAVQALAQLHALRAAGVAIAIDDFGTGYSSFDYLQKLPASVVKIDRSFVRDLASGDDPEAGEAAPAKGAHGAAGAGAVGAGAAAAARTLVRSMIQLSHDLGYRVVAEGVETRAVADVLRAKGCDEAQGYLFARPLAAPAFETWLREQTNMVQTT